MTRPDHYAALGVAKDASPAEIRRAFRKAASSNHPDRGGSDEQMQAINAAKDVLTDPERRARYDAGQDDKPSQIEAEARGLIRQLFAEAISKNVVNPFRSAMGGLQAGKIDARLRIDEHRMAIRHLSKQRGRIVATKGHNVYNDILDSAIESANGGIKRMEQTMAIADLAISILSGEYAPGDNEEEASIFATERLSFNHDRFQL